MNKEICTYYDELFEQQIIQKSVRQLQSLKDNGKQNMEASTYNYLGIGRFMCKFVYRDIPMVD